jgi:hypothetical protein
MTGKTIRIFLADGEPTGILLAEIGNWTGKVLVAPRSQLDQLSKREEAKDENLAKSHVRYLESRLIKLAQDAHCTKLTQHAIALQN